MRVALAQINPTVGELDGNLSKIKDFYQRACDKDADIVLFPELCICGYPPEDLLHKRHFLEDNVRAVEKLTQSINKTVAIVGFAEPADGGCYNSAAVIQNGSVIGTYRKGQLPNYGVFDESRYFIPGSKPFITELAGVKSAVTICRDIWDIDWLKGFMPKTYPFTVVLNLSSSPFNMGKVKIRKSVLADCAAGFDCVICYCNLVGGQDELVFDGRSMIADASGRIVARAKAFEEDLLIADIESPNKIKPLTTANEITDVVEEIYNALVLGTRDYIKKNNFDKVLIGLSGGIDSSVAAALATAALGKDNVTAITMPSQYSSRETKSDAGKLAQNLGIQLITVPIQETLEQFDKTLANVPGWNNKGVAYENLQARIRGTILMSLSNQSGAMVLTTGNKSETAVGYSTLYGDTAGGFAVIKDVPKMMVYNLARYINTRAQKEIIPETVIERPPSAELRENQKDTDALGEYELLDKILQGYIELDKSPKELIESGLPEEDVLRIIRMVDKNEYKRRQSPPGVKITPKAFGKDRRLPITNHYQAK